MAPSLSVNPFSMETSLPPHATDGVAGYGGPTNGHMTLCMPL